MELYVKLYALFMASIIHHIIEYAYFYISFLRIKMSWHFFFHAIPNFNPKTFLFLTIQNLKICFN